MSFLRRVARFSLRDRKRSTAIREELGVAPLLLRSERSRMRWFDLGCLPDASLARCSGHVPLVSGSQEDPGHAGGTMSLSWPGNTSGSPPEELDKVAGESEVWALLLRLLPP